MAPRGIGVGIVGMGAYLPEDVRTNDWWPADWREQHFERLQRDLLSSVDQAAAAGGAEVDPEVIRYAPAYLADLFKGVRERRVMSPDMMPSDLQVAACREALSNAGIFSEQVDVLLGYTTLPDAVLLDDATVVAHKLGLRQDVAAFTVSSACASFLHQLRLASRLIESGECDTVLIYVSSSTSPITDFTSPSSVVIGDGAVAAVVRRVEPGLGYVGTTSSTHGELHDGILLVRRDGSANDRWWNGQGAEFLMKRVDGAAAHVTGTKAASFCRATVQRLLHDHGARPEDVAFFGVSQAGAWFGRALADAVGVDHSKILGPEDQYEIFGHLMAGSVALNLVLAHRQGRLRKGDLVLLYAPGLGFVTAASLIRWSLEA